MPKFKAYSLFISAPARMISDSFEVEKQRENETKNGAHARFEPGTSKSLQKLSFFPSRPLDFTPRVRQEWKEKNNRLACNAAHVNGCTATHLLAVLITQS